MAEQDITLEQRGRCGLVTLSRPKALNALSYDMIGLMEEHYIEWAGEPDIYGIVMQSSDPRAFCSGGDIRTLYDWRKAGKLDKILQNYTIEYQHNWTLDRFIKPHVALMNGYVFGGGVGASLYGTHKVGGENYRMAMPEASIGFFPDVGASWFLPRLPGQIGMYLALTGEQIGREDAYALGLLTHCIDGNEFAQIVDAMREAEPIDPVLDSRHVDPGPSPLLEMQGAIDTHFSHDSVEAILESLDSAHGDEKDWASSACEKIRRNSPLSLKVTHHLMRNYPDLTLETSLELDGVIARHFLEGEEFYEGVRALLVDKDGKPAWKHASLEDVGEEEVLDYFQPKDDSEHFKPVNPFISPDA